MTRFVETAKIDPVLARMLEETRPSHRDASQGERGATAAREAAVRVRAMLSSLSSELRA